MNKTLIIILVVIVVLCCLGVVVAVALGALGGIAGYGLTAGPAKVGDNFMAALRDNQFDVAYGMLSPDLQNKLGSQAELRKLIINNNVQPVKWTFSSRNTSGITAQLEGTTTLTLDRKGTVTINLTQIGKTWLIEGFHLKED